MNHQVDGRKFGRNTSHRTAMFRNMANSVIAMEQITTTVQKAKEAKRVIDRLITLAKKGTPAARRLAFDRTRSDAIVKKLFTELKDRYENRAGGYTRVIKLSDRRWGDGAETAVLELVDHPAIDRKKKKKPDAITPPEGSDGAVQTAAAQAPVDPFSRFKKMFGPKTKSNVSGGGRASAPKSAARKTAPRASKKSSSD